MKRLERLLSMALYLGARRRVRAQDAAAHFGISLRTVYRDVQALVAAGFPIVGNAGDGYRVDAFMRPLALDEDEAEALAVASLSVSDKRSALLSATSKLQATLGPAARRRVAVLEKHVAEVPFRRAITPSPAMLEAIRESRAATIVYDGVRRTIEPVGLVCRADAWWVVAYCRLRRDARAFRTDHITAWVDAGPFALRSGFSFEEISRRDAHLVQSLFGY